MSPTPDQTPAAGAGHLYRELWRYAAGQRNIVVFAFTLLLTSQLLKLAVPYLSGRAINVLQLHGTAGLAQAGLWLALVFAATVVSWALHGPGRIMERNIALTVRERLSGALLEKLFSLPLAWHEAHHSGETVHRVNQSSHALYDFAQSQFIYLQNAVRIVGPVIALTLLAPSVGILSIIGFGLIGVVIARFDRSLMRLAAVENHTERRYAAALIDGLGNILSLLALRQRSGMARLIGQRLAAIFAPLKRSIVLNEAKWCSVDILSQALCCGLVALYAWLAAKGFSSGLQVSANGPTSVRLGNVFMVYQYALEASSVITAIASHFQSFARQQADYTSAQPIWSAAPSHLPNDSSTEKIRTHTWQTLHVHALTFSHARHREQRPALTAANFTLERGKRYALIGGSGTGKSTLLRILAGLYLPEQLRIALDQNTLDSALTAALALRRSATLIPQEAEVFEGSLLENLALQTATDPVETSAIAEVLEVAHANFVDASAAGLTAEISERGANLSGGQRQRLALARGILAARDSALILLDEPTASLDPEIERAVYANLFRLFADACVVSSVHRLNLLDRFDEVILLQHGRLLDKGSVADLTARCSAFRELLAAQQRHAQ